MLQGQDGKREFPGLAGQLKRIGQDNDFRRQRGIGQRFIMVHPLP